MSFFIDIIIEKIYFKDFHSFEFTLLEDDESYEENRILKIKKDIFYEYGIKNINNKYEVIKKVSDRVKNRFISNENLVKNFYNKNVDMDIVIWKSGIKETFGNDKYYKKLANEIKIAKIVTMDYLDEFIKYSIKRADDAKNYHNLNSNIKFSYLKIPVDIDGIVYYINIDIKKQNGINKFYIHYLQRKDFINKKESNLSQSQCG